MNKNSSKNNIFKNLITKKINIIILILVILLYIYFISGVNSSPVEDVDIPSGIGVDLTVDDMGNLKYSTPVSLYNYGEEEKITSFSHTVTGNTLDEAREEYQLMGNKKIIIGLERVVIIGEKLAKYGIRVPIDKLFKASTINDTALIAVCKGTSEDVLSFQVKGFPSAADYIAGLIEHSTEFNFFSNNYKIMDMFVRLDAEGRSIVLPYIEIKNNKLMITGMALFKKDIMVKKIDIEKARIMNLLREDGVKGVFTLQENLKEYISYYAKTKKKVSCEKKGDKYTFFIELSLIGDIVDNSLYHDIDKNKETMKKFQENMSKYVESLCYDFIKEMQNDYKVDCLGLGKYAAAKYGRKTGTDWDEVVSSSEIKVKVNVKVDKMGRGDF